MTNITIQRVDGVKSLLLGGLIQSVYPPQKGYWERMLPNFVPEKALVLGVGGGTVCRLLLDKFPDVGITGVDISEATIHAAIEHMNLGEVRMKLHITDAFDFVMTDSNKYDLIIIDLFDGYLFPLRVFANSFIVACKKLLNKGGQLIINTPNIDWAAMAQLPRAKRDVQESNVIYSWGFSKK